VSREDIEGLTAVFKLSKKVGVVSLSDLVEASTPYKVLPLNEDDPEDKELLRYVEFALESFLKRCEKEEIRFKGNRINEIGKKFESILVDEIDKTPLEVTMLETSGYPDLEVRQGTSHVTYFDVKSTANIKQEQTNYRMFYYSSGTKIKAHARHLLIQLQMQEEANKYWKCVAWELREMSKLKLRLKTEFNAGFKNFRETPLLSSSTDPKPTRKGQKQLKLQTG
jgi:hypothetical protein